MRQRKERHGQAVKKTIVAIVALVVTVVALWKLWPASTPAPSPESESAAASPVPAGPKAEGHLEAVNGRHVIGWAWDKQQPDAPIQVEIMDGVNPPVVVTAAKF